MTLVELLEQSRQHLADWIEEFLHAEYWQVYTAKSVTELAVRLLRELALAGNTYREQIMPPGQVTWLTNAVSNVHQRGLAYVRAEQSAASNKRAYPGIESDLADVEAWADCSRRLRGAMVDAYQAIRSALEGLEADALADGDMAVLVQRFEEADNLLYRWRLAQSLRELAEAEQAEALSFNSWVIERGKLQDQMAAGGFSGSVVSAVEACLRVLDTYSAIADEYMSIQCGPSAATHWRERTDMANALSSEGRVVAAKIREVLEAVAERPEINFIRPV